MILALKISNKFLLLLITCYLLLTSCKSDKPNPRPDNPIISLPNSSNVIVVNEGGFQHDDASLSFLESKTGQLTQDIFKPINGRNLGDVAQSATIWNNRLYVVVNNSQKIEVLNLADFHSVGTISGFSSPRYFLPVGNSKAYVSDLYANAISVVDLNSLSIVKTIPCKGWTERMIYHLGKVYVTNYWQSYLYIIDPLTDTKSDSIFIGKGAQSIVSDKKDRLVVACGGYKTAQTDSKLVFVNSFEKKVEKTILFVKDYPSMLTTNAMKDSFYFINTDVFKLSVDDSQVGSPFTLAGSRKLYGLGLDIRSNQVFVSDVVDYVQIGKVYVYSSSGAELTKFDTGINPGNFCFY